ncbi:MAG: trypsin-like peptidase domain-containing protein [Lachnospiraceae bacterium]|nr:trypsin-like peptidase domain-containing protein [Lachnospiraceae bacterium]
MWENEGFDHTGNGNGTDLPSGTDGMNTTPSSADTRPAESAAPVTEGSVSGPAPAAEAPRMAASGSEPAGGTATNYGQQNAWENPYTAQYRSAQTGNPYRNDPNAAQNSAYAGGSYAGGGYQYTNTAFNGGYQPGRAPAVRKKGSAGKKIAIACGVVAALGLMVFGLYEFAHRIPMKEIATEAQTQIEEQINPQEPAPAPAPAKGKEDSKEAVSPAAGSNAGESTSRVTTISAPSPVIVTDVTQVVESCMPAIVSIDNNFTETINYFGQRYTQEATGSGSGIIVGQNENSLLIATNYHVIEDADSLSVQFVDGTKAEAQIKDSDEAMDLAVIAVPLTQIGDSTMDSIVIATLGNSDTLTLGEPAIAIGNALGQGQSVTVGVVSAVNREIQTSQNTTGTFIQTDAAINPGNSGGALLNSAGEVIGINSNKFADTDVEGMGFAIPISQAQPIIDEMMNRELVADEDRGYLGISGTTVPYEYTGIEGVRVRGVTGGSGAEAAGLQEDDIIIRLNGENIKSMESLQNKLKYLKAGDQVTLTILRRENDRYVEVDVDVKLTDGKTAGVSGSEQQAPAGGNGNDGSRQGGNGQGDPGAGGGQGDDGYYYYGNGDDGYGGFYGFPFNFPFFGGGNY